MIRSFVTSVVLKNIMRITVLRMVRWTGHVAHMGAMKSAHTYTHIQLGNLKEREHIQDLNVDNNSTILKWIIEK